MYYDMSTGSYVLRTKSKMSLLLVAAFLSSLCGQVQPENCQDTSIRLTPTTTLQSPDQNVGRVEVCRNGTWGTISLNSTFDFWSDKNVQVACRQLGFSGGLNSIPPNYISPADKPPSTELLVHLSTVFCYGQETSVFDCPLKVSPPMSSHLNDVFIVCLPRENDYSELHVAGEQLGDVRLFGSQENGHGGVEIFTQLGWTGICPEGWGNSDAHTLCQTLGYDLGTANNFVMSNTGLKRSVYDGVCSNTVEHQNSRVQAKTCSFLEVLDAGDCPNAEGVYAGIMCFTSGTSSGRPVRLFGRSLFSPSRAVGVVEVFLNSRWGVVCANQLNSTNANALCQEFFTREEDAKVVQLPTASLAKYESRLKPLWTNKLDCLNSNENCALEFPLGFGSCSADHILALDCGPIALPKEGNTTAIIVGMGVVVFIFAVIFCVLFKVLYIMFHKNRSTTAVTSASYNMPAINQNGAAAAAAAAANNGDQKVDDQKVATNSAGYEEDKLAQA